jgi:hypothetical protein
MNDHTDDPDFFEEPKFEDGHFCNRCNCLEKRRIDGRIYFLCGRYHVPFNSDDDGGFYKCLELCMLDEKLHKIAFNIEKIESRIIEKFPDMQPWERR